MSQSAPAFKTPRFYGKRRLAPELTSFIGIVSGLGLLGYALVRGGSVTIFLNLNAFMITFGGTVAATFIAFSTREVVNVFRIVINIFRTQIREPKEIVRAIVQLAIVLKKGNNLVLEQEEKKIGDQYLRKSIAYVVDGVDESVISDYMMAEIESKRLRHENGQRIFRTMGMFAPAFGLIGTIIGLVQMLQALEDPGGIGPAMAVAMITTFYGACLANLVFLPISEKLKSRTEQELFLMHLTYTGIMSLRQYMAPHVIEKKLNAFVEARDKVKVKRV